MLVKNWMSTGVISIGADDSMEKAIRLQKENNVGMLPVMDKGKLVGVVTNRDLRSASFSKVVPMDIREVLYVCSKIKIRQIMTPHPFTVLNEQTVEEAAEILLKNEISGAPVVDSKGKIVGVITRSDILRVLISVISGDEAGYQFSFRLPDQPGATREIVEIVHNYNGRIASMVSSHQGTATLGFRDVYMRIYNIKSEDLPLFVKDVQKKAILNYYVDFLLNERKIFEK